MDGILLVNKPKDMTSRDIVNIISKELDCHKVGHTGTLDPLATGVLAIAINKGLKIVDYLTNDTKEYIATAKLGIMTDTLDINGQEITKITDFEVKKDQLKQALKSFLGKSEQEVPLYSALKVNGRRLYDYARRNIAVTLPKREIEVFKIELLSLDKDTFTFKVLVSKGTYIRSLIRDIGKVINIPCVMQKLQRTRQGDFKIENSYTLAQIATGNYQLISLQEALHKEKQIVVDSFIASKIANGRILENRYEDDKIVFLNQQGDVLAIYQVYDKDPSKIKPLKVLS